MGKAGQNFPVDERYEGHILDAATISRGGGWWTAALLINDPETNEPFVEIYRWQSKESGWRTRKKIKIRKKHLKLLADTLVEFADQV